MKPPAVMFAALALLTGCQKRGAESLVSRVLFVANGSYDASADQRTRLGGGLRRVQWSRQPPLEAAQVTVDYDSDHRPSAWIMTLKGPRLSTEALLKGSEYRNVTTPAGPGQVVTSGDLKEVLILPGDGELKLVNRGYVIQHRQEWLGAFGP